MIIENCAEHNAPLCYHRKVNPPSTRDSSDRELGVLLRAERALGQLEVIFEALQPSGIGWERIDARCHALEAALGLLRGRLT